MTKLESLIHEMENAPDFILEELLDFARYLKSKKLKEGMASAFASETSLDKVWLTPEEDEAWKDL